MSSRSRQKRACRQQLECCDQLSASQLVAMVVRTCGGNLVEVEDSGGARYLSSLPQRLRRCVWLRRGSYVLLEPIGEGRRVRAEVVRVLTEEHRTELGLAGQWPARFSPVDEGERTGRGDVTVQPGLEQYVNTNRRLGISDSSDDSSDCSSDEEDRKYDMEKPVMPDCVDQSESDSADVSHTSSSSDQVRIAIDSLDICSA